MPIVVACRCGQRFQAQDHLAGKTVRCPSCSQPLQIPALVQPVASAAQGDAFWDALNSPPPTASGPAQDLALRHSGYAAPNTLGIQCQKCGYTGKSFSARVGYRWWTLPVLLVAVASGVGIIAVVIIISVIRRQTYTACPKCRGRKLNRWQGHMTPESERVWMNAPARDRMLFKVYGLITLGVLLLVLGAALIFMFSMFNK